MVQSSSDRNAIQIGFFTDASQNPTLLFQSHVGPYVNSAKSRETEMHQRCWAESTLEEHTPQVNDEGKIWVLSISSVWEKLLLWISLQLQAASEEYCGWVIRLWYLICIFTGNCRQQAVLNVWYKKKKKCVLPADWIKWSRVEPSLVLHSPARSYLLWYKC